MAERVKKTLEMYPVHTSYHLDVLSCEARRYDFDEKVRMAADECVEYKKMIVREFEKYGFCVTSEGATRPFAGVIGHAWSGYGDSSPYSITIVFIRLWECSFTGYCLALVTKIRRHTFGCRMRSEYRRRSKAVLQARLLFVHVANGSFAR